MSASVSIYRVSDATLDTLKAERLVTDDFLYSMRKSKFRVDDLLHSRMSELESSIMAPEGTIRSQHIEVTIGYFSIKALANLLEDETSAEPYFQYDHSQQDREILQIQWSLLLELLRAANNCDEAILVVRS